MLESFLLVARQVGILFVLIAIGYVCNKIRLFGESAVKGMTELMLYVVTPCLLISAFQRDYEVALLGGLALAFLVFSVSIIISIAIAHTVMRDPDARRLGVLRFAMVFSNCGYMSLPLQQAILGS